MTIIFATLVREHPMSQSAHSSADPRPLVAIELPPNCRLFGGSAEVEKMVADVIETLSIRETIAPSSDYPDFSEERCQLQAVRAILAGPVAIIELPDGSQLHRLPSDALRAIARKYFREGTMCMNDSTDEEIERWFDEIWKRERLP